MPSLRYLTYLALLLIAVGCDTVDPPTEIPTTPTPTPINTVAPSATVLPIVLTPFNTEGANVGELGFTPGAAATVGSSGATVTPKPAPTDASLAVQFLTSDGLTIAATFYSAASRPAPTVLLLPGLSDTKETWRPLASQLQATGYDVLAIDLRGQGATGGTADWAKAVQDVETVLNRLSTLPGVDPQRVYVIGANIGANLAINACADFAACQGIVLLSPALDIQGVAASEAMTRYGKHPVLIAASKGDPQSGKDSPALDKLAQGDHKLQLYDGTASGIVLLTSQSTLPGLIAQWLATHK